MSDDYDPELGKAVLAAIDSAANGLQDALRNARRLTVVDGVGQLQFSETVKGTLSDVGGAFLNSLKNRISDLEDMRAAAQSSFDALDTTEQTNADRLNGSGSADAGVSVNTNPAATQSDTRVSTKPLEENPPALSLEQIQEGAGAMDKSSVDRIATRWYDLNVAVTQTMETFIKAVRVPFADGRLKSNGLDAMLKGFEDYSTSMDGFTEAVSGIKKTISSFGSELQRTKDAVPGLGTEIMLYAGAALMNPALAATMPFVASPYIKEEMTNQAREAIETIYNPAVTTLKSAVPPEAPSSFNPLTGQSPEAGGSPGGGVTGSSGAGTGSYGSGGGAGAGSGAGARTGAGAGGSGMDPSQLTQGLGAGGAPEGMDDALAGGALGAMGGLGGLGAGGGGGGGASAASAAMRARQAAEAAARLAAQESAAARGARAGTSMMPGPMMGGRGASASEKSDQHKAAAYLRAKHMQEEGLGEPHNYTPEVVDEKSVRSFLNLDTTEDRNDDPPGSKK